MKKLLLMSIVAAGFFCVSSPSFAMPFMPNFGPVYEMKTGDHMMHMQMIQDADGDQWVVMSRKEAEQLLGQTLDAHPYTKVEHK
jgi:hypothetical protein